MFRMGEKCGSSRFDKLLSILYQISILYYSRVYYSILYESIVY